MSWSSAASRTTGRPPATHRPRAACGPTGPRPRPCSGHAALRRELGRDGRQQAGVGQQPQPDRRRGAASSLSSSAAIRSPDRCATSSARVPDPGERRRLDLELEGRGEPDGADHPQRVLLEPRRRVADRAQDAGRAHRRGRRTDRRARAARPGAAPQAIALTVKSRRARSSLDRVAELDPVRPPEVGVVVVGPEGRDLEVAVAGRAGPRPSRTGSRRRRPGTARAICSGSASGREVPVGRGPPEQRRRAASRRRRTPRDRRPRASAAGRGRQPGSRAARSAAAAVGRQFRPRNR